jgi:hypothetical protein
MTCIIVLILMKYRYKIAILRIIRKKVMCDFCSGHTEARRSMWLMIPSVLDLGYILMGVMIRRGEGEDECDGMAMI